VYIDCNGVSETVTYTLGECRLANTFWNRVQSAMSIRVGQHLDTAFILPLQKRQGSRWLHSSNEMTLIVSCCLWTAHRAHICRLHNTTAMIIDFYGHNSVNCCTALYSAAQQLSLALRVPHSMKTSVEIYS
jgi:hypothetical protein